jgi:hypothetical protein
LFKGWHVGNIFIGIFFSSFDYVASALSFSLFVVKRLGNGVYSGVELEGGKAGCMASSGHDFSISYNRQWLC